ncbi:DnaJ domain containing protein [Melia azedarach]|uniref:DnaJ domain containing protein n=1 Tax=Melia azedarach TaxID=155640 RepID=A0ACC1Z3Y7_MELAZ|nr:DnaJ domain containing protein [Melia azedarach]
MEANIEEALKAKEIAEKRFLEKDFAGAKNYALKAKTLCPGLEGIAQMVATFEVYFASEIKCNGEIDYYSVLGLKPSANKEAVKKQYRKMAVLLHPDKNKCVGADGAFKLVSEAWTLLSDSGKRSSYDLKRNKQVTSGVVQTNLSSVYASGVTGFNNCPNSSISHTRLDTFWTVCTSCKVQYEYLRKYVNKRLSCKNCRGTFIAVETGTAPVNGSFPYTPWSYVSANGYGSHGYDGHGVTYVPTNATIITGNGIAGFHSGHGYEYVSNVSFQYSSISGTSTGIVSPNGSSATTTDALYHINGNINSAGSKVKSSSNGKHSVPSSNETPGSKASRPDKRRKVVVEANSRNGSEERGFKSGFEVSFANGGTNNEHDSKLSRPTEVPNKRCSIAPTFDARKLLIDKARTEIRKKLEEMRLAAEAVARVKENTKSKTDARPSVEVSKRVDLVVTGNKPEPNKNRPLAITVPDPDFHDFDKDRSEECFKPKQIWAIYDEDDGMPRLYCLIRQIISATPFKILITYLSSKTDSEFGSVKWVDSGFTKSCGHFRAFNSDVVDQVNIFSHLLRGEKAGRGGCVRIFPKTGEIWAVYRNWSPDWNRSTPDDVRHQYEMVEVLDDYSEELGVCVTPLTKLSGFKTVYQSNTDKNAFRWIPRREMLRFSHQVPSFSLKGEATNLPGKCWDLDPAATPDELLHAAPETETT